MRRKPATLESAPTKSASAQKKLSLTSTGAKKNFPIVGIGASAGGLEAFSELLRHLPTDTGMAFVLVQHLDPDHESLLPSLLANTTAMRVVQVKTGMRVRPNQLHVIPPNAGMIIEKRVLKLLPRQHGAGHRRGIDTFFESLAHSQHQEAIGVILSGTASDGTLGLEAIKGEGGLTFAQDETAKFSSMPRSAVHAGCVDFVLPPAGIARELARIARHPLLARGDESTGPEAPLAEFKEGFNDILKLMHRATSIDFALYKPGTLHRRVKRRMVLNKLEHLPAYGRFLQEHPEEVQALAQDFLIGVTTFFRDAPSFEYLQKKTFPKLLEAREKLGGDEPVRVWVPGCSTGQEVYSLAMLWLEFAEKRRAHVPIQIFGTDVNEVCLEKARTAVYSKALLHDVSPARLRRFFYEADGGYRVTKSIREKCVFARQNLATDPPFSRMDLVSCRNVLIYLQPEVQKRIFYAFRFALRPTGFLFLGRAEATSGFDGLFTTVDRKHRVFTRKSGQPNEEMVVRASREAGTQAAKPIPFAPVSLEIGNLDAQNEADRVLLTRYAPASVVVNADFEIVQFRGHTGTYLESPPGRATMNALKMAREGLYAPLRAILLKVKRTGLGAKEKDVTVGQGTHTMTIDLEVLPLKRQNKVPQFFLVIFQPVEIAEARDVLPKSLPTNGAKKNGGRLRSGTEVAKAETRDLLRLKRELDDTKAHLQAVIDDQETYSEELQAANEEAQASNEELQSINEELETSKEELQATNEELGTINAELQTRNSDLTLANEDLANLLGSVRLPIVMVGIDLRIRRFNAAASAVLNLIPTDVGRPISNLRAPMESVDLEALLSEVTRDMVVQQREVQDRQGRWFLLRVHPYRTTENKIDGAILLLIDIDELKRTTESRDYSEAILNTLHEPLVVLRPDLRVNSANRAYYETFRAHARDTEGRPFYELAQGQWNQPKLRELLGDFMLRNQHFSDFEFTADFGASGRRTLLLNARRLDDGSGQAQKILLAIEDITARRQNEEAVRASEMRYRRLFESAKDGILILNPATRKIIDVNPFMSDFLGHRREEFLGRELWEFGLVKDEAANRQFFRQLKDTSFVRNDNLPLRTKRGEARDVELVSNLYREGDHDVIQCNIRDVTERQRLERSLHAAEEFGRLMIDSVRDHAIFTTDPEGRVQTWNKGAEQMFGYADAEIIGQPVKILYTPEDRAAGVPKQEMTLAKNSGHSPDERWHLRKGGSRFFVSGEMTPILGPDGKLRGFTKVARDITQRREREAALAEQARLLDLSNDAIIVRDPNHIITYWNRGAEELYGWKRNEAVGQNLHTLLKCEFPEPLDCILGNLNQHARWSGEIIQTTREGQKLTVASRWAIDRDAKGRPTALLETNTDITVSKQSEVALREAKDRLSHQAKELEQNVIERTNDLTTTNKQLEAFVYTVAHDLRAPLRAMQGFSSALLDENGEKLSKQGRDFAARISRSAEFMDTLLRDLMAFSSLSQQRVELTPVNLETSVQIALSQLEREMQEHKARVELAGPWPLVLAHSPILGQVLTNLVSNAMKFTAPGVRPTVRLRTEERGEFIRVWVEDNGIGIAPEYQEQIFGLFKRLHGEAYIGTGIGLAIVQKGVERMGGRVGVESILGKGSRFWFELRQA